MDGNNILFSAMRNLPNDDISKVVCKNFGGVPLLDNQHFSLLAAGLTK